MTDTTDITAAAQAAASGWRAGLEQLVRIPSVSADGFDPAPVRQAAGAVAAMLEQAGLRSCRLLEVDGAHPAVYGERLDAGDGAPTVLLYAHYDVQPPGDERAWTSPPFVPAQRDGRLYGRGTADDKGGVIVHAAATAAWTQVRGTPPVNVKVFVEGEEETGSEHLPQFLQRYGYLLGADVLVLTDSANWRVGVPALTYLLRGLVDCEVEVRGLDHALHSGMYGGPVPDPLSGLCKLLAGLTDDRGAVAVPGIADDVRRPSAAEVARLEALDFDTDRFRAEAGMLPGVAFTGDPATGVLQRLWMQPAVAVLGIDAPAVDTAPNALVPSARALVSLRLAPGQDPGRARRLLAEWLAAHAPWGLDVRVTPGAAAPGFAAEPSGPVYQAAARALTEAFGRPVAYVGVGGTIPFVDAFTRAFPEAVALLTGVADPDTRAHGVDESVHLGDLGAACLAEAYLFDELALL